MPSWIVCIEGTNLSTVFYPYIFKLDWQKAFNRVNWTKLMQIPKGTGIEGVKEN